jgi:hypothetical protein
MRTWINIARRQAMESLSELACLALISLFCWLLFVAAAVW